MSFRDLRNLLREVHNPRRMTFHLENGSDFKVQSISDAVAMSGAVNVFGLSHLVHSLVDLTYDALHQGFFVRGAIVKGPLYHDDQMVFGEALVRAYSLEQEVVRYPRIMVASEVVADVQRHLEKHPDGDLADRVQQAKDGPYFLDVLKTSGDEARRFVRAMMEAKTVEEKRDAEYDLGPLFHLRRQIQGRFIEAVDTPRHFEKVQWFASYWNRVVGACAPQLLVDGPGTTPNSAYWG
jgi:hypothetical protein